MIIRLVARYRVISLNTITTRVMKRHRHLNYSFAFLVCAPVATLDAIVLLQLVDVGNMTNEAYQYPCQAHRPPLK